MDDHYFSINDGFAWNGQRASDLDEALGPVQPVAGKDFLPSPVEMDLNAVAIVLDLMEPLLALGALVSRVASWGLMNPGISIRFGTRETHKRPPHLGGQWRAFYLLPEHLEQSGDVTALTTTNGLQIFPIQIPASKHRDSTESSIPLNAINLLVPAWCFHPEQIWAGGGPQQCGPFAIQA
jgi:hypothetical protein